MVLMIATMLHSIAGNCLPVYVMTVCVDNPSTLTKLMDREPQAIGVVSDAGHFSRCSLLHQLQDE